MYKVGDKVRLNERGAKALQVAVMCDGHKAMVAGLVGTVTAVDYRMYVVRFDDHAFPTNGTDNGWYLYVEEIEPVTPPAAPPTPRIDPSVIERLNEVVAMLERAKRSAFYRRAHYNARYERSKNEMERYVRKTRLDREVAEHDAIVARIEAVKAAVRELTKEA